MATDIILSVDVAADAATTFRTLTTSEGQASFWTTNCDVSDTEARFGFDEAPVDLRMRVEAMEEGKLVRWACLGDFPGWAGSTIEWELAPALHTDELAVTLRHTGLGAEYDDDRALGNVAHTWAMILDRLRTHLATGEPTPFFS